MVKVPRLPSSFAHLLLPSFSVSADPGHAGPGQGPPAGLREHRAGQDLHARPGCHDQPGQRGRLPLPPRAEPVRQLPLSYLAKLNAKRSCGQWGAQETGASGVGYGCRGRHGYRKEETSRYHNVQSYCLVETWPIMFLGRRPVHAYAPHINYTYSLSTRLCDRSQSTCT